MDSENSDFRPAPGSRLIDARELVKGITHDYNGKSPDIGAYESGGKRWTAGADWSAGNGR